MWCRRQRLFKNSVESVLVLQGLELLSICKSGPWDFVSVPYLFKNTRISVPVLEGIKLLWLLMVTKMFMNISEGSVEQWCAHLQKLCASPSHLCFYGQVEFLFFLLLFFFPYFPLLHSPFLHSLHCDCSANARLKKMSFLFQCIILPFDLDTLKRMSYNVESAKSVLFSAIC